MSTAAVYSLSTVCQYLTLYCVFVLCHYVHFCILQSVHCLSVPQTIPSVGSVPLCPLLPSKVCPLSVCMSLCIVFFNMCTAAFYSLSNVCQYLTLYRHLAVCHYVHCCLPQLFHCLSVYHTVPSVGSVSLCPLLSSTVCPLSVSTSHCTMCWFCVTMSTAAFYIPSNVSQYLTLYRQLFLCHYVHCCLLQSVHFLSVRHTVSTVGSVSLCLMLPSTVSPLSVSVSHCTDCWLCVSMSTAAFYSLSTVSHYLTLYILSTVCQFLTLCNLSAVGTSYCTD